MFPFILIGKIIAWQKPLSEEYDVFYFFPAYTIGGAERVNAEIVKTMADKKGIIFFTKHSPNKGMLHFFKLPHITIKEINTYTDNKFKYWNNLIYRGVCSAYINRQKQKPVVFIGQCNFAYKLTPHINRSIRIVELIHMYDPQFTWVWAPFISFIHTRVLLAKSIKDTFANVYQKQGIPMQYLKRIVVIPNCLEYMPTNYVNRNFNLPLKIYYAGRGGPQKRVWLIVQIIEECKRQNLPVTFTLAGSFKNELPQNLIEDGIYIGELAGGKAMYDLHQQQDILLMTSAWEGFPMVIMEAMAYGAVPLVCDVDAIPDHIHEGENGFLLNAKQSEIEIVNQAVTKIKTLVNNPSELIPISKNGFEYVQKHFSTQQFIDAYRNAFFN